ncbi:MAG TPA: ABC transporter permease subunit [Myxococcales bacterium]|nr:ABC transporter permease subunit [Myxococcales bacterium]
MKQRSLLLWISSLVALLVAYTVVAGALRRPDILPTTPEILQTFGSLLVRGNPPPAGEMHHEHHQHQMRSSDQVDTLVQQGVTLQDALLVSTARVLFGLLVGLPLGILIGVLLGWSRRADDYLHSVYVLIRSVPPLAFITYIMLWLGHSEAHRLIPIVYAVAVTAVIPTYHAVRDVAGRYLVAARSLGARGRLLVTKVLLPAASPAVLGGLRYAVAIAWMTAVGAEMLMAENGMGNLLVGGGMWSSRMQTRSDPAVIIAGVITLAAAGWAMDALARMLTAHLTRWVR